MLKHSFYDFEQRTYNFTDLEKELAAVPTAANSSYYKSYAYTKEKNKPIIIFGSSEKDILLKLQNYNLARTKKETFVTCSISVLNLMTNRYDHYKNFYVETELEVLPIPLIIPGMNKTEFRKVTSVLKKMGAKFNSFKKEWYITEDMDKNNFKDYLEPF